MFREIQQFLGRSWADFQSLFAASLRSGIPLLEKANRYVLTHGGKKLRPALTLLIAKALGGPCDERVLSCAVAAELLHTATLMHDDVADDAPVRRGVPTMKALYSPATAVLIGDFWLARAMGKVIDHPDKRVLHVFSKCLADLAEGEMLQLQKAEKLDLEEADYRKVIYCKTTSLFEAAVLSGAFSVGAGPALCDSCRAYAYHLGQAFQMRDDMLDYLPELSSGKPVGQDILEKKITLPLFGLFARAPRSVVRDLRRRMHDPDPALAQDAIALVRQYDGLGYARECLAAELSAATEALAPLPASEARDYLEKLAGQLTLTTV